MSLPKILQKGTFGEPCAFPNKASSHGFNGLTQDGPSKSCAVDSFKGLHSGPGGEAYWGHYGGPTGGLFEGLCESPYVEGPYGVTYKLGAIEIEMDLDLLSWRPEKLSVFAGEVGRLKVRWDEDLRQLMRRFQVNDEAALLSGFVDANSGGPLRHVDSWNGKVGRNWAVSLCSCYG